MQSLGQLDKTLHPALLGELETSGCFQPRGRRLQATLPVKGAQPRTGNLMRLGRRKKWVDLAPLLFVGTELRANLRRSFNHSLAPIMS